jgi:hypothetical protein
MKEFIKDQIEGKKIVIETLEAQIESLGDTRKELEESMKARREENLQALFSEVTKEFGVKPFQNYEGSYTFRHEDKPGSDLFTIYSRRDWREEGFEKAMNFYTTTCDNDFEFRRLAALGKVAEKVKALSAGELFNIINEGTEKMKEDDRVLRKDQNALMKARNEAQNAVGKLEDELIEMDLMADGVEFEQPLNLVVGTGNKIDCFDVVSVRITKKSASGKTCDVKIIKEVRIYDFEKGGYTDEAQRQVIVYDRVKTEDLIFSVGYYKEKQLKELANTAS